MKRIVIVVAAAFAAACSPQKPTPPGARLDTSLPMAELMSHVVDPAAFTYWRGSGTEVTAAGERDLAPTTPQGWETLENGAASLIEAGNLLQLPGRRRAPEADWNRYAQMLTARAIVAKAAAERHDAKAVYQEGARLYEVCTACHKQYVIDPQLRANGPPVGEPLPPWPKDFARKR